VVFGVVTWMWLPDSPRDVRWLSPQEQEHVSSRIAEEAAATRAKHAGAGSLRFALTHPTVWLLCLVLFCCQTGSYGLTLWVPTIVKEISGLGNLGTGFVSAIPYVVAAIAMMGISASSDRSGERFLHLAVPTAIGAAGFIATAASKSPLPAMIALSVAAAGDYGTRGPFWALPGKFLTGESAAAGIAMINAFAAIGGYIGPVAVGALKDATGTFESGLYLLAGILLIGSLLTLILRKSPTFETGTGFRRS